MPEMVGTYEEPDKFHEGCKRNYSSEHCAAKVQYQSDINHYRVICKRKE